MFIRTISIYCIAGLSICLPISASATSEQELSELRDQVKQLKQIYETKIEQLELRLKQAEADIKQARPKADITTAPAAASLASGVGQTPVNRGNAHNPNLSLILSGTYADSSKNPADYRISGFIPGGEIAPPKRGFSLGESELVFSANIDPYLFGGLTLALNSENETEVEEAFVQSTALSRGFTVKGGRFFSGIGYLNEHHAHAWDFVDQPLAYKAFLGNQFGQDGLQVKWIAPTELFFEAGVEGGRGHNFPGTENNKNGFGSGALFAHIGGDIGASHSWRSGLSLLRTSPRNREFDALDLSGATAKNSFTGDSKLWLADFVWKWAPQGNSIDKSFKLQGEYFRRKENGNLTYDSDGALGLTTIDAYSAAQSGWYLQGIYKFLPRWRTGVRIDRLNHGTVNLAANAANLPNPNYDPSRYSLMLDYSPSEFSVFRIQFSQDKSSLNGADHQLFLRYITSLGPHGAHKY